LTLDPQAPPPTVNVQATPPSEDGLATEVIDSVCAVKLANMVVLELIVTVQVLSVWDASLHVTPLQEENVYPVLGVSVNISDVPLLIVDGQLLLLQATVPLPEILTVNGSATVKLTVPLVIELTVVLLLSALSNCTALKVSAVGVVEAELLTVN